MTTQKWVNLGLLGVAALLFSLSSKLFQLVADLARWPVATGWAVEPIYLAAFVVAVGGSFWIRWYGRANGFFNEVALELGKVTWPQRKETVASTGVVIFLVGIAALILFLIDFLWGTVTSGLFRY
mgnify:CR=1 FL=1